MRAIIVLLILLTGCTSQPYREFNSDDLQDHDCYHHYGALMGYCDLVADE